jgi:hypothetical protein
VGTAGPTTEEPERERRMRGGAAGPSEGVMRALSLAAADPSPRGTGSGGGVRGSSAAANASSKAPWRCDDADAAAAAAVSAASFTWESGGPSFSGLLPLAPEGPPGATAAAWAEVARREGRIGLPVT